MEIKNLINFLNIAEKLKCNTRHSWTSTGRHESVAEHSWRLSLMAFLLKDKFNQLNMEKVIIMSIVHDLGEAITGDIPAFTKTEADEESENREIFNLISTLDGPIQNELHDIIQEILQQKTPESRIFKALDKIEVVLQHNEAPLETWIELEYELNLTYGEEEVKEFPYLHELRKILKEISEEKIKLNS